MHNEYTERMMFKCNYSLMCFALIASGADMNLQWREVKRVGDG